MRFHSSLCALTLVAAISGIPQAAPVRRIVPKGAVSFTSKWQKFSIWFPIPITTKYRVGITSNREKVPIYVMSSENNSLFYHIFVFTHPRSVDVTNPKARLDMDQKSALKKPGRRLHSSEEIQLGKYLGRDFQIFESDTKWIQRSRWYLTPKRYYQISVYGKAAEIQKQVAQINRVFDSFRISPQ